MQSVSNGVATTTGTTEAELLRELSKFLQEAALETEPSNVEGVGFGSSAVDANADGAYDKAFAELWELCTSGTPSTASSSTATPIPPVLPGLQPIPALFPSVPAHPPAATATSANLRAATLILPVRALRRGVSLQFQLPPSTITLHLCLGLQECNTLEICSRMRAGVVSKAIRRRVLPSRRNHCQWFHEAPTTADYPRTRAIVNHLRALLTGNLRWDSAQSYRLSLRRTTCLGPSSSFPLKASPTTHDLSTGIAAVPRPAHVPAASVPRTTAPPIKFPLLIRDTDRPAAPWSSLELAEQRGPAPQRAPVLRPARCTIAVKAPTQKKRSGTKRKASAVDAENTAAARRGPPAKKMKVGRKTKQEQPAVAGPGPGTLALREPRHESNVETNSAPSSEKTSRDSDAQLAPVPNNAGSRSERAVLEDLIQGVDAHAFDELWQLLESPLEESNDNSQ
ncbi:hypothetical protein EXIGLDRAFT_743906 [Exidia glandulosa HHB12029]|uniref:Uncharacterized protein n=1 Tax=Exidia glandulosa HHB12029 TaxID=1314781 RepID=A0A165QCQ8_EXIGL|nr:hypothetical protein EXIGLDRAFT_743906 [Exidia glandulosa HHB12029]